MAAGNIISTNPGSAQLGNAVMVYHQELGLYTIYLHMQSPPEVKQNDYVDTNTILGYVGATGNAGGKPHVHFEIRTFSDWFNPKSLSCANGRPNIYACWSSVEDGSGNILPWVYSDYRNPETYTISSNTANIGVALVIDSSGSMSWNDPSDMRKEAARIFVDTAGNEDWMAIIDFDDYSYVRWAYQPLTADRTAAKSAIDLIDSLGGTSLSAGLTAAYNQIAMCMEGQPEKVAVVMLTDGQGYYDNEAALFSAQGWEIFTFGLGSEVDAALLTGIAEQTGGLYYPLTDPSLLKKLYFELSIQMQSGEKQMEQEVLLRTGETYLAQAQIPAGQLTGIFMSSWSGSDVDMTLVSPGGRKIDASTNDADVYHAKGLTYNLYRITNPEPGEWDVSIYGVDLDPEGETVSMTAATVPDQSKSENGSSEDTEDTTGGDSGHHDGGLCFITVFGSTPNFLVAFVPLPLVVLVRSLKAMREK